MKVVTAVIVGQDAYCARILEFALNGRRLNVVRSNLTLGLTSLLEAYRPEIVLLEVDTPDLDCAAVVQFLRGSPDTGGARVLLYSNRDVDAAEAQAARYGADGHVAVAKEVAVTERHLEPWLVS